MNSDIELKFLAGLPVDIDDNLKITVPTIRDIINIGYSKYYSILSTLLTNKDSFKELSTQEITNFELFFMFSLQDNQFWKVVKEGLYFLFKEEPELRNEHNELFIYFGENRDKRIDNSNFDYFQNLLIFSHNIKFEREEFKPANAEAKKLLDKLAKMTPNSTKKKKEEIFDFGSKVSGIAWKSHTMNIFQVLDLNIYQFYDAVNRLEQVDSYMFTLQGIYAGNVDSKKINLTNLHWSKKFKGV